MLRTHRDTVAVSRCIEKAITGDSEPETGMIDASGSNLATLHKDD
ncbi:hypothetical protein [Paraburkholderia tropica]|nr:hypothetical protein [Paraburkholderia tropica]